MKLSSTQLTRLAAETRFQSEPLEKALHLLELLEALRSHPFLSDRLVLKGGTAINLFVLDLPRLSVDVDLNYVGALGRDEMLEERTEVEAAVRAVCTRQRLDVRRAPGEHAGGKWRLGYERAQGGWASLELDMNFLLRTPLWPPSVRDSLTIGPWGARRIPVVDFHELVAGKLSALFSRTASRDLFDAHALLSRGGFDQMKIRFAFVVYGAMSRRDWRTVSLDDIEIDSKDVKRRLLPLLRSDGAPAPSGLDAWCRRLVSEFRDLASLVLPLDEGEREFLEHLNGRGSIVPELLTDEPDMQEVVARHPALLWKARNVRRFLQEGG